MSAPAMRFLDRASPPHIFTLIVLTGLGALSMNIFLPSLPAMTEHFSTDYRVMQLSVALYLAVNAMLQIVSARSRTVTAAARSCWWGIVIFLLATLGCLVAPTIEVFLAFRMLQAVSWWASSSAARWCATCIPRTRPPARSAMSRWAWPWCR
jgi:DHA1 family bicyclomycin/chloramphenicol resistance-like MFS transporter